MTSVVSYGGGVNSTALLCGLVSIGENPDLILFADTGNEWPDTYEYIELFSKWLESQKAPPITKIKRQTGSFESLEEECLKNKTLPSLAFGFRGCSVKWKRQVMDRFIKREFGPAKKTWGRGEKVRRILGIDAGESHRGLIPECKFFTYERPLVDWGWWREECIQAIESEGLPIPRKSACWFCPATTKIEVQRLAKERPELWKRAVKMEKNAKENLGVIKGLGRHWSWEEVGKASRAQLDLFPPDTTEINCMCFDGDST